MDKEFIILEQIQNNPHVNQRDLATVAQASLGMTNAILKRFAAKGLITIKKVNNRNIRYALTSEGVEEISRRSWSYFKRTIKNVVVYQDALTEIVKQAKSERFKGIALVGKSDFEFMIEHICLKEKFSFAAALEKSEVSEDWFVLIAETPQESIEKEDESSFSLNRLVYDKQG